MAPIDVGQLTVGQPRHEVAKHLPWEVAASRPEDAKRQLRRRSHRKGVQRPASGKDRTFDPARALQLGKDDLVITLATDGFDRYPSVLELLEEREGPQTTELAKQSAHYTANRGCRF